MKRITFFMCSATVTVVPAITLTEVAAAETTLSAPPAAQHRNPAMMYTGMALTGLGSAALVGGAGIFLYDAGFGHGYAAVFIGVPLMLGSALFAGVGIPLWVSGARAPGPSPQAFRTTAIPTVSIGPRFVSMRWDF